MQSQGACLLFPVALFGRAWWIYDAISQGWAAQVPGFPKPAARGEREKEEKKRPVKTCQKWAAPRAGEVLDLG